MAGEVSAYEKTRHGDQPRRKCKLRALKHTTSLLCPVEAQTVPSSSSTRTQPLSAVLHGCTVPVSNPDHIDEYTKVKDLKSTPEGSEQWVACLYNYPDRHFMPVRPTVADSSRNPKDLSRHAVFSTYGANTLTQHYPADFDTDIPAIFTSPRLWRRGCVTENGPTRLLGHVLRKPICVYLHSKTVAGAPIRC